MVVFYSYIKFPFWARCFQPAKMEVYETQIGAIMDSVTHCIWCIWGHGGCVSHIIAQEENWGCKMQLNVINANKGK